MMKDRLEIERHDTKYYIANCISLILAAPCLPANEQHRSEEIARGVEIAYSEGEDQAYSYFLDMVTEWQDISPKETK